MKTIVQPILLGACCFVLWHLIAFTCSEGIANEMLSAPRKTSVFTYTSAEGIGIAIALFFIVKALSTVRKTVLYVTPILSVIIFSILFPLLEVSLNTEVFLTINIFCNLALFPTMWYFILKTKPSPSCCENDLS